MFVYGEQAYAEGWFLFAADSCGVFDQSVSSLQYVLADLESAVISMVIAGGAGVFDSEIELRREHLQAEADRIAAHDSLDSVSGLQLGLNERLLREEETLGIEAALKMWLTGVGAKLYNRSKGSFQIASRSRLQVPFALQLAMAPWFDTELAVCRQAAVERSVPLVRPGHGLLDEIVHHLLDDDRGVAFAFIRPVQGCWPPIAVFRTDFVVQAATMRNLDRTAREQGVASWLQIQQESLLPPLLETVYMSDLGAEITSPVVTNSYTPAMGDRNLVSQPALFDKVAAHLDWEAVCGQGLMNARRILNGRDSVGPRTVRSAQALKSSIYSQVLALRARTATDLDPPDEQIKAFEALALAVPNRLGVVVEAIGAGVIFLADPGVVEE